jgi:uncharacterized NAD(P)/FAD-binding protein YdhS
MTRMPLQPRTGANLPRGIATVVESLEARDGGVMAPATLASALRAPLTIDDVAPFVRFSAANYTRNLVTRTDRWELRLLCWRPGQSTTVHGHGGAACAFRVLRGSAAELVLGERDRIWPPSAVVEESSRLLIHQVSNPGADPLLTLHAYSPPLPVDEPSSPKGRAVVIVGGGFSGAAVAYHLLRRARSDLRITIVERGPWIGRGVAYGVESGIYRLNVPASRMSIDPDEPNGFVAWARAEDRPTAFLQRSRYGEYVVASLGRAIRESAGKLRIVRGEVVAAGPEGVRLSSGATLAAEAVVFATGLAPRISTGTLADDARVIDAWDECALAGLPSDGRILVLGAGLSALDIVAMLEARRYRGAITILSRRGLLPRPHLDPVTAPAPLPEELRELPRNLRELLRWGRAVVDRYRKDGAPWQHGVDAIRPFVTDVWAGLPPEDRQRFARSIRPYWDVLRHRAPMDVTQLLGTLRAANRLEVIAGRVLSCEPQEAGIDVRIGLRLGETRRTRYDFVIRCLGAALESIESETPLLRSLVDAGLALRDPAGLGVVADRHGAIVGPTGASDVHFAIGALRRATEWESTSVPDISKQARDLAIRILS